MSNTANAASGLTGDAPKEEVDKMTGGDYHYLCPEGV